MDRTICITMGMYFARSVGETVYSLMRYRLGSVILHKPIDTADALHLDLVDLLAQSILPDSVQRPRHPRRASSLLRVPPHEEVEKVEQIYSPIAASVESVSSL